MPAGFGMGDHRLFMVDFQEENLIGKAPFRVKRFTSRWLNTKVSSGAVRKYLSQLEKNLEHHQLIECIEELHTKHKSRRKFQ